MSVVVLSLLNSDGVLFHCSRTGEGHPHHHRTSLGNHRNTQEKSYFNLIPSTSVTRPTFGLICPEHIVEHTKLRGRVVIRNKTGKSKSAVSKRNIEDMIFGEP